MASLTPEQIYQVCLQAGFTPDQAVTWTAIAMAESGGNPAAHNPSGEDSRGLWQINIDPDVRGNHWGDLNDPLTNARAAFEVSGGGTNMRPWTVTHASNQGTDHDYRNFMDEARAAAAASGHNAQGDFSGVSGYDDPSGMGADEPAGFVPSAPASPVATIAPAPAPPPTGVDSDADGALDDYEMSVGTDPNSPDSDDDGLTDGFELLHGSNPLEIDSDQDGLSDGREAQLGTNAMEADTDADGMSDPLELAAERDPLRGVNANGGNGSEGEPTEGETTGDQPGGSGDPGGSGGEPPIDSDDDGLSDAWEADLGTDPLQADTDADHITDALEQAGGTDPLRADSDGDGMLDDLDTDDTDGPGFLDGGGDPGGGGLPATQVLAAPGFPGVPGIPGVAGADGGLGGLAAPVGASPLASPLAVDGGVAVGAPPAGLAADPDNTAQQFIDAALRQAGDSYVFGAEADTADADPETFDCSELVQWAAAQAGVELPDGSWIQYTELEQQGAVIPVEQAIDTPGALLFRFSSDPTAGGRPSQAHVAISLGDGRTIEARGTEYGVGSFEAGDRFTYAAVIPGLSGAAAVPGDDALAGLPTLPGLPPTASGVMAAPVTALDSDFDGVTDAYEMSAGTNPMMGDSDGDGLTDGFEVATGSTGMGVDSDGDGLSDAYETQVGTTTTVADSDGDGLADSLEMAAGRDALHGVAVDQLGGDGAVLDADGDGLSDVWESSMGSDGTSDDSDGDGLTDALELVRHTDPHDPDSDEDGFTDGLDDDFDDD